MVSYFNESFYLKEKLAQLKVVDPNGDLNGGKPWATTSEVQAAFTANGLTAEQHFEQYGQYEGLSPVAEFVADEYLAMKAAQLNSIKQDGKSDWTADSALAAIQGAGLSAWSHYVQYGDKEGISPSYALDGDKYCQAKADAMNAAAGEGEKSDWTAAEIKTAINDANMSVLDHFETYAGTAANEADKADYPVDHKPFQFDLTTDVDTVAGTAADEIINGATGTSRVATLNDGDMIDGGAGTDTLNVDMAKNFTGFKDGYMKDVEIVNLDSSASSAVSFSGKGSEGVQTYNLSGVVNLQDLSAADITVNLADRAKGAASIKFADEAVKGKADTLNLGLDNVGTVDADKGDTPVAVTINGIEELTVNAAGENAVTLNGGNAVKALTVTGDGDLNAALADTSLESVDASAATGDLSVDLTAANSKLASVILGSGNDTLTLGANAAIDLSINGGAGDDEVVLQGLAGGVKELQMGNVETLTIDSNTAALTLSGAKTTGLQTVKLDAAGAAVTLADFQNSALNLQFVDTIAAAGVIVADVANLNLIVGDDDDTLDSMAGDITAADATSIALNIADKASYSGALVADQATSLTLDSASSLALNFGAATDLSSIENMVLKSNGAVFFDAAVQLGGNSDSIAVDAAAVKGAFSAEFDAYAKGGASLEVVGSHLAGNTITVNGGYDDIDVTGGIQVDTITLKDVDDADIRLNTGLGKDVVSITAAAKAEDISVSGNLGNNGESVTVDGSAATSGIKIDLSGLEGYAESTISGGGNGILIGGAGDDTFTLHGAASAGAISTFTLTGGLGKDTYAHTAATGETIMTVTEADFNVAEGDNFTGFAAVKVTAAQVVTFLGTIGITADAADITFADGADATQAVYMGNSYLLTATAMADGESAIQLLGVTADVTDHITA
ncbi:MAG: beta strand repeat-containing protein [Desulfovibrio fairfieldensis]